MLTEKNRSHPRSACTENCSVIKWYDRKIQSPLEPMDAPEGKWTLGGGIEIPCRYILYGEKKDKGCIRNKFK